VGFKSISELQQLTDASLYQPDAIQSKTTFSDVGKRSLLPHLPRACRQREEHTRRLLLYRIVAINLARMDITRPKIAFGVADASLYQPRRA
jgi:hypothetical protein